MDKKVILITGASGGIGLELANFLNQDNHHLILHYFQNGIDLPASDNITIIQADLTKADEMNRMVNEVLSKFKKVDVLINNSGISRNAVTWKTSDEDWEETLSVNLTAPFKISRALIPSMRKQNDGVIINISSVVAQTGVPGTAAYAASKAGLIGLTKTMAKELASNNIRVNALSLGYFEKGMISNVPEDIKNEIVSHIPMKTLGSVQTICKTIAWLMDNDSTYITGQVINLNGGLYS
jgi:NAD(P)-dependent dehydrogenase (short-subunit alcohol dehydrogenase family)